MAEIIKAPGQEVIPVTQHPETFYDTVKNHAQIVLSGPDDWPTMGMVKMTPAGRIIKVRSRIQLSRTHGHIWVMKGYREKPDQLLISSSGFDYIQRSLGASFFKPKPANPITGNIEPNPVILKDGKETYAIDINMIGFYRNSMGNYTAIDSTLHYELEPARRLDLLKKWEGNKDWGEILNADSLTEDDKKQPGIRHFYIDEGVVLKVTLAHPDVLKIMREHAQRKKFASIIAQTIIRRNLIKKMIGLDRVGDDLTVTIDVWPEDDMTSFSQISQLAERLKAGTLMIEGKRVEVEQQVCEIDETESLAVGDTHELDDGNQQPIDASPMLEPASSPVDEGEAKSKKIREQIRDKCQEIGVERTLIAFDLCGLDGMEGVSDLDYVKLNELHMRLTSAVVQMKHDRETQDGKGRSDDKIIDQDSESRGIQGG